MVLLSPASKLKSVKSIEISQSLSYSVVTIKSSSPEPVFLTDKVYIALFPSTTFFEILDTASNSTSGLGVMYILKIEFLTQLSLLSESVTLTLTS